jgi:hypothetical protein
MLQAAHRVALRPQVLVDVLLKKDHGEAFDPAD